ncbi:MAG: response regulator transcription factor [Verrucomicrobia bacterium]|jgi:two-component system, NarL family, invasion response regulator UvrY|nr:response regulator transcription factor [Verrucomicrobiota bacterium]MBT7065525.1 response regulator transcription factor [Verrucomicrobiota bacterium]MBT7700873.1 response regulator transcription factor [Verrucomicrobiota bacterium]
MRIFLADDHGLVRGGLKLMLAEALKDATFGEAEDCRQTLEATLGHHWDLVILDLSMPGRGGLDVLKELRAQQPKTPVLVLSMHAEKQFAVRALRAGAAGYLTKASAGTELIKAVKHILAGGRYVSAALAEQLAAELGRTDGGVLHERLSAREFEILRMIATGKTVKEIAYEMKLSHNTISTYRTRVLEKMQMRTNAELTHYAISRKLVME